LDYCIDLKFDFNSQFLFLAAGSRSGNIGMLNVNLDGCSVLFTLKDGHGEGIIRDVNWDTNTGILISASEDGHLVIWKN
jgi:WD40 repeat protein